MMPNLPNMFYKYYLLRHPWAQDIVISVFIDFGDDLFFSETPMLDSIWPISLLHFTTEKTTREMSDYSCGLNKGLLLGKLS